MANGAGQAFATGLLKTYAGLTLQNVRERRDREMAAAQAKLGYIQAAILSGRLSSSEADQALQEYDQTIGELSGKGKKAKFGLHTILSRLVGREPTDAAKTPPFVPEGEAPVAQPASAQAGAPPAAPRPTVSPVPSRPSLPRIPSDIEQARRASQAQVEQLRQSGVWKGLTPQERAEVMTGMRFPNPRGTIKVVQDPNSPTGWSYASIDPSTNALTGPLQTGATPPAAAQPKRFAYTVPGDPREHFGFQRGTELVDRDNRPLPASARPSRGGPGSKVAALADALQSSDPNLTDDEAVRRASSLYVQEERQRFYNSVLLGQGRGQLNRVRAAVESGELTPQIARSVLAWASTEATRRMNELDPTAEGLTVQQVEDQVLAGLGLTRDELSAALRKGGGKPSRSAPAAKAGSSSALPKGWNR